MLIVQESDETIRGGETKAENPRPSITHAWNWFKYHAEQRMLAMRFYLIMAGALGAGYIAASNNKNDFAALIIALFGAMISFLFRRLDMRVSALIKLGEAALAKEEEFLSRAIGYEEINIIRNADKNQPIWFASYSKVFRAIFYGATAAFTLAALHPLFNLMPIATIATGVSQCLEVFAK